MAIGFVKYSNYEKFQIDLTEIMDLKTLMKLRNFHRTRWRHTKILLDKRFVNIKLIINNLDYKAIFIVDFVL